MDSALNLFPLSKKVVFDLPSLSSGDIDTYKTFFINELLCLETSATRNFKPAYIRHKDGSANIAIHDVILDTSSFYLFAHKALISTIFIFCKTIPRTDAQSIPFASFGKFYNAVFKNETEIQRKIFQTNGKNLTWAKRVIIDKRDDLVQHWQGNSSNKFFPSVFPWDLPLLVYCNPNAVSDMDNRRIDYVLAQVKKAIKADIDEKSSSLQKIAWMEAWEPKLSDQLKKEVYRLCDNDKFITLPVTGQLVEQLDQVIYSLIAQAISIRGNQ